MKKVIVLTLLVMVLLSSICMAYTPSRDWEPIGTHLGANYYYDKSNIQYSENKLFCHVWVMAIKNDVPVLLLYVYTKNKTHAQLCYFVCLDYNSKKDYYELWGPFSLDGNKKYSPIPKNNIHQSIYNAVFP